jgi:DNA-directed RNA polymerase specialized sigma24 family protein
VTAVVDRQAANVLERHRAAKRGLGRCQPLCTVPSETEPSDEPICSGGQDATALRLDMEQVLRRLPVELQKLCILLKTESAAETARLLGISARTLYRRRKRVRMFLADAGFGADCGFLCASSRAVPVVT